MLWTHYGGYCVILIFQSERDADNFYCNYVVVFESITRYFLSLNEPATFETNTRSRSLSVYVTDAFNQTEFN